MVKPPHDAEDGEEVERVLGLVLALAPADVVETVDWLQNSGWHTSKGQGSGPFGLWVEFTGARGVVAVVCDRSQWMLNIKLPAWKRQVDLDIVLDTINGRSDWSQSVAPELAGQLPPGVWWREALPRALDWLASTPDSERALHDMQRKRSRSLFPPTRRSRQG